LIALAASVIRWSEARSSTVKVVGQNPRVNPHPGLGTHQRTRPSPRQRERHAAALREVARRVDYRENGWRHDRCAAHSPAVYQPTQGSLPLTLPFPPSLPLLCFLRGVGPPDEAARRVGRGAGRRLLGQPRPCTGRDAPTDAPPRSTSLPVLLVSPASVSLPPWVSSPPVLWLSRPPVLWLPPPSVLWCSRGHPARPGWLNDASVHAKQGFGVSPLSRDDHDGSSRRCATATLRRTS